MMNQNDDELVNTPRRVPRPQPCSRTLTTPVFTIRGMLWRMLVVFIAMGVLMLGLIWGLGLVTVTAWAQSSDEVEHLTEEVEQSIFSDKTINPPPSPKMSAEDKITVLKMMLKFSAEQVELSGMIRQMEKKAQVVRELGRVMTGEMEKLKVKYQAEGCLLDEDVEWVCGKEEK